MEEKTGLTIALILAIIFNFFSYWFSDKIVLNMYGAKVVDKNSILYELVIVVAIRANLPIPNVYIIEEEAPNALATGRDPNHSAVVFTTGILRILDEREEN